MAARERYPNARASLFDRLVDADPFQTDEHIPLRASSRRDLLESVRREISRILNTRIILHDGDTTRTVLNYGVRDYAAFYPANQENQRSLGMMITQALAAFEPRLANVRVTVRPAAVEHGLVIRIDAVLATEGVSQPVSFPVVIRNRDAAIEVSPGE
jgi:type VI secretion system lysozyme-like protein